MKTTIIGGLAMAVVLGFAHVAPAKSLRALLGVASQPTGTTFTTGSGNPVWAHAYGYDSGGVLKCQARGYVNNTWGVAGSCPAAAVKHHAQLRSTGDIHCSSVQVAWNTKQVCWPSNSMWLSPNGGALVNVGTVQAWSDPIL